MSHTTTMIISAVFIAVAFICIASWKRTAIRMARNGHPGRCNLQSSILYDAARIMSSAVSSDRIIHHLIDAARSISSVAGASFWSYDRSRNGFIVSACNGTTRFSPGSEVRDASLWLVDTADSTPVNIPDWPVSDSEQFTALLVTLRTEDGLHGVLEVVLSNPLMIDSDTQSCVGQLVELAAMSLCRAQLTDTLREEVHGLKWLSEITSKIEIDQGLSDVLDAIVCAGTNILEADRIGIYLGDCNGANPHCAASIGLSEEFNALIRERNTGSSIEQIKLPETITCIEDVTASKMLVEQLKDALTKEGIGSILMTKLVCNKRHIGLLVAFYNKNRTFSTTLRQVAEALSTEAAVAINYAFLLEKSRELVAELEDANRKLTSQATSDGLTGLANHRAFHQRIGNEIRRAERYHETFTLAMLDVDRFKAFNDAFGHKEGDVALQLVASEIAHSVRATDFPARYGGEEFAVILPHTDKHQAFHVLERLRKRIQTAPSPKRQVSVSIGLCEYPTDGSSPDELIDKADRALYHAKITGRNRVCVWGSDNNEETGLQTDLVPKADISVLVITQDSCPKIDCADILSSAGYMVCSAKTVDEALHLLKTVKFDIILTESQFIRDVDIHTYSTISGMHPSLPIISVTESISRDVARKVVQNGMMDLLIRPVDSYELSLAIERNLERRRIERVKVLEKDGGVLLQAIEAMAAAIDAKDHLTTGHSARVTDICLGIADVLALPSDERCILELAARLHDVGKIALPDSALNKASTLDDEEWQAVRQHPIVGSQIVGNIKELSSVANIIRHHHERLDGSGYPDGLKGEAIPRLARILAVADTFEAMTSSRSYKVNITEQQALQQIMNQVPEQFETEAVNALAKSLSTKENYHIAAA